MVDLNLGSESGLDLVRQWRVEGRFPVLILSARSAPVDRIVGLEMGAEDYVVKPFEPRELQLRLRIALSRNASTTASRQRLGRWEVGRGIFDTARRAVEVGTRKISLTTAEFRLIDLFVRHPHQVLSRDHIMDSVHLRQRHFATDRSVDMMIARLRKKLMETSIQIEAIRGSGYMLCSSVSRLS